MKFLLCLSLLLSSVSFAMPGAKFGMVTGLNIASFTNTTGLSSSLGVDLGAAMLTSLGKNSLLTELTYTTYGAKIDLDFGSAGSISASDSIGYLEIKPKFMLNLAPAIALSVGPNLGIKVKGEGAKSIRAGANAGLAFNWMAGNMHLIPRVEYDFGLTNSAEGGNSKINAIKFSLTTLF